MGAQDKTENALRELHLLLSKADYLDSSKTMVIVDKQKILDQLKILGDCMYEMLDENELTAAGREKGERERARQYDEQRKNAEKQAEDIYAASMMYSDNTLSRIQDIIAKAEQKADEMYDELKSRLREEKQTVRTNQYDLKENLQNLADSKEYLRLIRNENERIRKEEGKNSGEFTEESDRNPYADIKPIININPAYIPRNNTSVGLDDLNDTDISADFDKPADGSDDENL